MAAELLVAVGDVTPTSAVLWARDSEASAVSVRFGERNGVASELSLSLRRENDRTGKLTLTALRPATRYEYTAQAATASASGTFVTAPGPDQAAAVKFLWSGDLGGGDFCRPRNGGYHIFTGMLRHQPDFFLLVGDTVYADRRCGPEAVSGGDFVAVSLPQFRARHRHQREDPAYQRFLRGTSVYAIWDDHEVRNDFAGTTEPLMPTARRAFLEYWPIVPPADEPARLYRKFRWGRLLEVFILDTRQYRSPNTEIDGPGKTMLGAAQRRWVIDNVSTSTALWKVIVTSVSLSVPTGRHHRDSWSNASILGIPQEHSTGFAVERDTILRAFRERGVRNVVFVAADVHHAELIRHHPTHEFSFHEFIAGPLSASLGRPRPLDDGLNPRSLFARGGVFNFGEIAIDQAALVVRIVDGDGGVLFTHSVGVE